MKKTLFILSLCLAQLSAISQTSRTFTVSVSADGSANMQVFIPENSSGRAVVDCPGGGYSHLSMQSEGTDWADYFNRQGIVYAVLAYRMPGGDRSMPISDAQNAIMMMRDSAATWGVNPYDVGIMGFSAGGHLASTIATHAPMGARPNFQILFYPVISMDEKATHKGSVAAFLGDSRGDEQLVREYSNDRQTRRHATPPAIIILAGDDSAVPPLTNAIAYYSAMRKAGVPAAMYVYPSGGHGFGFKPSFKYHDAMLNELTLWLNSLEAPRADAKRVACIGNSITDGHGLDMADVNAYPAQLQSMLGDGFYVRNFGVSGRTMLNGGDRPYVNEKAWAEAQAFNPDIAVIKLGTNDSKPVNWDGRGSEVFAADFQQMIDSLKALPSQPEIFVCTPLRVDMSKSQEGATQIRDSVITAAVIPAVKMIAEKNNLRVIDLNPLIDPTSDMMQRDGIHPSAKGARVMAEAVAREIAER